MKIVVLSDTHIPQSAEDLPPKVYEALKGADLILHAGDITSPQVVEKLRKNAELKAVWGNMDGAEIRNMFPPKQNISIGKFHIGLIHGWGAPAGLLEVVKKEFLLEEPQIIIFGHSHQPLNLHKDGILFFNPGSPTDKVFTDVNSYGIITIDDEIKAEIIKI